MRGVFSVSSQHGFVVGSIERILKLSPSEVLSPSYNSTGDKYQLALRYTGDMTLHSLHLELPVVHCIFEPLIFGGLLCEPEAKAHFPSQVRPNIQGMPSRKD